MSRAFHDASALVDDNLALALAPALTPDGLAESPIFFSGFAAQPLVLARGLLTLADITSTRYFQFSPSAQRDPVLTAHGDRLRAEVFSACNSVYARLDLLPDAFDSGELAHGTTNVDINLATRAALGRVARDQLLHLDIGASGLTVSTLDETATERPVEMPARWVRAFGNVAELHHGLPHAFTLSGPLAKAFLAALPGVTSTGRDGWLTAKGQLSPRRAAGGVKVRGLHRLGALKRLLPHVTGASVHGTQEQGPVVVTVDLPGARITLGLTDEAWRGHSGEGSLLTGLAGPQALEDADLLAALLAFEPVIDLGRLERDSGLTTQRVRGGLAVLAASGRVGWDTADDAWFHRELPHDPSHVDKDNPRLVRARALVESGSVQQDGDGVWRVTSGDGPGYTVRRGDGALTCTCTWYLRHGTGRGPCAHALAADLASRERA